ncbi:MAG: protein-glutamate O-methyltransferase CheR [bacterium]|nr:protein-glutamate O-methyltransferase CheR [bacterium]
MTALPRLGGDSEQVTQSDFNYVRNMIKKHSAVSLDDSKAYLVSSRLLPVARSEGFDTVPQLISKLKTLPFGRLHLASVEALITTETSFFRDFHPFEALREIVIPDLIRDRRRTSKSFTIWSAACSSGQEPHSISIMLREYFPMLQDWPLTLIASDVSHSMIQRAKEGLYLQHEINRGLPARLLVKYFKQEKTKWRLKPEFARMFQYLQHNITHDWSNIPQVDVLLLRNVLIYFDVAERRQVLYRVRRTLKPGGLLILGAAETTLSLDDGFERVQCGRSVLYRVGKGKTR